MLCDFFVVKRWKCCIELNFFFLSDDEGKYGHSFTYGRVLVWEFMLILYRGELRLKFFVVMVTCCEQQASNHSEISCDWHVG